MLAPICLFVYSRVEETKKTIDLLSKNALASESDLHIFSDGAKYDGALLKVNEVRDYIKTVSGFKSVTINESEVNRGLAASITQGVTQITKKYGKAIVLEDDILTSKGFLSYMNKALDFYQDDDSVMQISSFMFPIESEGLPDTFFHQANNCWGWATWERAWRHYNHDAEWLLKQLENKGISWDTFNAMQGKEYQKQLLKNISGDLNTWAVKWHAMIKLKDGKVLHPKSSYVANIGFSGDGENCPKGLVEGRIDDSLDLDVVAASKLSGEEALRRLGNYCKKRYSFWGKCKRRLQGYWVSYVRS